MVINKKIVSLALAASIITGTATTITHCETLSKCLKFFSSKYGVRVIAGAAFIGGACSKYYAVQQKNKNAERVAFYLTHTGWTSLFLSSERCKICALWPFWNMLEGYRP